MLGQPMRRLWLALGVSLLAHVALLVGLPTVLPLRFAAAGSGIQASIKVRDRAIAGETPQPVPIGVTPAPSPMAARAKAPVHSPGGGKSLRQPKPAASATAVAGQAPLSAVTPALGGQAVARAEVNPDDLRQYRVALAVAARRFKRYPPLARENGWQGRVEVELSMSVGEYVPALSVARSSGRSVLDRQALSMIEQASASTVLPESMRGRSFRLLLPIEFSLDPGD
ncbi:TonB family protein [Accumulibacter sp.]|uniref:TonB family protein n=1 Tax=Accumulibacter sp. TaxID=2053492 RepID=UPI0026026257|nr:TonB family protein [Accumulibacter sp.]